MKKTVFLFSAFLLLASPLHAETVARIVAVVNNQIITSSEFQDRLNLVLTASTLPNNADTKQKLGPQILRNLIEEQLRLQEATKQKITVDDKEVAAGFAQIAQQNNMQPEQFQNELRRAGVNDKTLHDQVRAQVAWSKLLRERVVPKVQVNPPEVDSYLARLRGNIGKPQYLLAEIFLPVDEPAQEKDVVQLSGTHY